MTVALVGALAWGEVRALQDTDSAEDSAPSESTDTDVAGDAAGVQEKERAEKKEKRALKKTARKARKEDAASSEEGAASPDPEAEEDVASEPDSSSQLNDADTEAAAAGASDTTESEPEDDSNASEAESESIGDVDSEEDADHDSDKPVTVEITTDAPSMVFVNDRPKGALAPGETLEVDVELGDLKVKATSAEAPGASWVKELVVEEIKDVSVKVRMARALRLFRKKERQEGVFRDVKRDLMWVKRDNGRDVDLRNAYAHCRDLRTGGFEGWRLPTLAELESLESIWQRGTYKILGGIQLSDCCIWSSDYDGTSRAWTFNYRHRRPFETNAGYSLGLRTLCVREWDSEAEAAERARQKEEAALEERNRARELEDASEPGPPIENDSGTDPDS